MSILLNLHLANVSVITKDVSGSHIITSLAKKKQKDTDFGDIDHQPEVGPNEVPFTVKIRSYYQLRVVRFVQLFLTHGLNPHLIIFHNDHDELIEIIFFKKLTPPPAFVVKL